HLLALGPDTEGAIAFKTRAPIDIIRRVLCKVGNRTRAGTQWELVDACYRELDLWKFKYKSQKDRDIAIARAKAAFERLRVPMFAPEWDMLVKPEDRGKVKAGPA